MEKSYGHLAFSDGGKWEFWEGADGDVYQSSTSCPVMSLTGRRFGRWCCLRSWWTLHSQSVYDLDSEDNDA